MSVVAEFGVNTLIAAGVGLAAYAALGVVWVMVGVAGRYMDREQYVLALLALTLPTVVLAAVLMTAGGA